jgi:CxxC motif-containing protein (DUF1111 family)
MAGSQGKVTHVPFKGCRHYQSVTRFSTARIGRMYPATVKKLIFGALGVCGMAFMIAASVAVDADHTAKNGSAAAPQDNAADQPVEAATGFNDSTNGFEDQDTFDKDRGAFEDVETILPTKNGSHGGLGPVYNGTSCVGCHQNPVSGSSSQVSEIRAGHLEPDPDDPTKEVFVEPPGGSLIHQRAIDAAAQEHVPPDENVPVEKRKRTLRMSTNILGDGFVEIIPDQVILDVQSKQPNGLKGLAVAVPVAVRGKQISDRDFTFEFVERIGRFGWKCQEASLINFGAGAYLNEMGITSPLQPKENTSNGRDVSQFDQVLDPEDKDDKKDPEHPFGEDVKAFARFMRSTKAPPRDFSFAGTDLVKDGEKIFDDETTPKDKKLGCAICHHPCYTTPKAGTPIKSLYPGSKKPGSDLGTVPEALGNKMIHPYSDFMLHDIGTGDGIAQTQHAQRPPRGVENLERLPEDIVPGKGILRVMRTRRAERKKQVPGDVCPEAEVSVNLDQRTINMIRTAPLWGLRVRPQLLHDGSALTLDEAIRRHKVTSKPANVDLPGNYDKLSNEQKKQLKAFLNSL